MARDEGWLAEHMLILKLTSPEGRGSVHPGGLPVGLRQDQPGDARSPPPGWKVETIGDDICWMKFGPDGRLWAINPEYGFFGVAPGTNSKTNLNAMLTLAANCVFTNTALTDDGDVWWEGMTNEKPQHLTDWRGQDLDAGVGPHRPLTRTPGSPLRPRRTRRSLPSGRIPPGVPISAILFGGRRSTSFR